MTSVTMPRWTLYIIVTSLIAALSFSVGAVYTARGDSHDQTFYACLYAGSLSQVGTTEPANCGRGSVIQWTSFGGEIDAAQLSAEVQQQLKCSAYPRSGIDFSGCDFVRSNLSGAYLSSAHLLGAQLFGSILVGTNLAGANLTGANLRFTTLTNANLSFADLTNANFIEAIDFGTADTSFATFCNTTMPNGTINNADCPSQGRHAAIAMLSVPHIV
jgi:hypothetical protein